MRLTILGSGTGLPSARRGSPGLFVEADGLRILVDSGPGTLRNLVRLGVSLRDLHYILYTHFHPDHTLDFLALAFALRNPDLEQPPQPIRVYAPMGFLNLLKGLRSGYGRWIEPPPESLSVAELPIKTAETRISNSVSVKYFPMNHTSASLGYRIEQAGGGSVAFSGDTDDCEELVALGRDADILVLECSFPDGQKREGHLTPSLAGAAAQKAGARKLVLTHFYPPCDQVDVVKQCSSAYDGAIVAAEDFMEFQC